MSDPDNVTRGYELLFNCNFDGANQQFRSAAPRALVSIVGEAWVTFLRAATLFTVEDIKNAITKLTAVEEEAKRAVAACHSGTDASAKAAASALHGDVLFILAVSKFLTKSVMDALRGASLLRSAAKAYQEASALAESAGLPVQFDRMQDELLNRVVGRKDATGAGAPGHEAAAAAESLCGDGMLATSALAFGTGTLNLVLSFLPSIVLKLIKLNVVPNISALWGGGGGQADALQGDKLTGLGALHLASKLHISHAPMAGVVLVNYYTYVTIFHTPIESSAVEAAAGLTERLVKAHPESGLAYYMLGRLCRAKADLEGAEAAFQGAIDRIPGGREATGLRHFGEYDLAWVHMLRGRYAAALPIWTAHERDSEWSPAFYVYLQAMCHYSMGNTAETEAAMRRVPGLVHATSFGGGKHPIEAFIEQRVNHYVAQADAGVKEDTKRLFAPLEELSLLWNYFEEVEGLTSIMQKLESAAGIPAPQQYTSAKGTKLTRPHFVPDPPVASGGGGGGFMGGLFKRRKTSEQEELAAASGAGWLSRRDWGMYLIMKGSSWRVAGKPHKALTCFQAAIDLHLPVGGGCYVAPLAHYEKAVSLIRMREYSSAEANLKVASDNFTGYGFEARLQFRIARAREDIAKGQSGQLPETLLACKADLQRVPACAVTVPATASSCSAPAVEAPSSESILSASEDA
jgi:tetratricopeptide (TPR) repeat protein